MQYKAALEVGGTFIQVGIGAFNGDKWEITHRHTIDTKDPEDTLLELVSYLQKFQFESIQIASFGPLCLDKLDKNYGCITTTPKLKWQYFPIGPRLSKMLNLPFFIDTDVNACAMAEFKLGNHGVRQSLAYITVGTGVGVGLIVNGQCVHGMLHPEGGHILVGKKEEDKNFEGVCAFHGDCLEGLCTNVAIAKRLQCQITDLPNVDDNHPVWELVGQYLATVCLNLLYMLSIEKIVIGGGVLNRKILYVSKWIRSSSRQLCCRTISARLWIDWCIIINMNAHTRRKIPHLDVPEFQDNQAMIAYAKCQFCCGECCGFLRTWMPCIFCLCVNYPYQEVEQGTEGLFKRFGRHIKVVRPGLHYVNPCTDTLEQLDLRITVIDLDRQSVMTKDNVTISIDASVYYRIKTARFAVYRVENYDQAVRQITYAVLKNTVGSFVLQDLLEKRQEVADQIEDQVDEYVKDWGVLIDNIYMKDIQLSPDLQQALGSAATESRLAQGKLISAKADVESAKLMRQASEFLDSKTAMQVRYLETLQSLANSNGTKVCFVPDEKNQEKLMHQITQGLLA